uniref:TNF receptor-associated factor 1-like n=1 Tax=Podarcis muralis TaxID=64176 RepID=A0A670HU63_PODMU
MSCEMSSPECLKEKGIELLTHFDKVSLRYQQAHDEQVGGTMASQHSHLFGALQQLSGLDKLWERLKSDLPCKQKLGELETRQKTLENIVSVLSRELGRREEAPANALGEAMARILYLEEKVQQQDSLLTLKDVMISNLASRLQVLEQTTYDGCFFWKVPEMGLRLQEVQTGNRPALYSPTFYTSRYGYKLCLKLFLNGDGAGAGSHLSLFLVLMRGEHDFHLKWPFRHKVRGLLCLGYKGKVKGPLTIRSSRDRLWGCGLALLAEGAGVQLLGHVASMTKPLLANQSSARKHRLPSRLFIYFHFEVLSNC